MSQFLRETRHAASEQSSADETAATVRYQNSLLGAERTLMSPFWPGCIHHQRRRYSPLMPQLPPGPDLFITAASKMNSWTPTTHTDIYHLAGGENMNETLVQAQNIFTHNLGRHLGDGTADSCKTFSSIMI